MVFNLWFAVIFEGEFAICVQIRYHLTFWMCEFEIENLFELWMSPTFGQSGNKDVKTCMRVHYACQYQLEMVKPELVISINFIRLWQKGNIAWFMVRSLDCAPGHWMCIYLNCISTWWNRSMFFQRIVLMDSRCGIEIHSRNLLVQWMYMCYTDRQEQNM